MIKIDEDKKTLSVGAEEMDLYSPAAFAVLGRIWNHVGWANKYSYQFTWMGRPIIQQPEDMVRVQEFVYKVKPTLIIETGIAHGGSLIYSAALLKMMGGGRVVGVDIEIRPHNREAMEAHELSPMISMIEGSSISPDIIARVQSHIRADDKVMVFLDSNHTYAHVLEELRLYASMVSVGSYIVATDGIMKELAEAAVPGSGEGWESDHPQRAVEEFLRENDNFVLEQPKPVFSQSHTDYVHTYWPNAWLRRVK